MSSKPSLKMILSLSLALVLLAGAITTHIHSHRQAHIPCDALAGSLPEEVPETTVLEIRNEDGYRFASNRAANLSPIVEEAIVEFGLEDRFIIDFGRENHSLPSDAHVLPVAVLLEKNLWAGLIPSLGKMCGNLILLNYQGDHDLDRRITVHELGHFLGLCHEEETWMEPSANDGSKDMDLFSEQQLEVLDDWNKVGEEYIPHWQWGHRDGLNCD